MRVKTNGEGESSCVQCDILVRPLINYGRDSRSGRPLRAKAGPTCPPPVLSCGETLLHVSSL